MGKNDYMSSQGNDSVMGDQLDVKEEETTVPPQIDPLTNQPLFQSLIPSTRPASIQAKISLTNLESILQVAESSSHDSSTDELRHMRMKLNRLEKKQKDMHTDLHNSMEKIAKLMNSNMKLIDKTLETKVNRFLGHISLDKGKAYKYLFVPDSLSFKTPTIKTDHKMLHTVPTVFYGDLGRQHVDALPLKMER